ncbi:MAG: hypothetical protein GY757_17945 [bacterium]|nr:hypothetical protein [bacterium]
MKRIILAICFLLIVTICFAGKLATFEDINRPNMLVVDNERMFIADGFNVHIYSMKDFKRIKTFGQKGEGPGEFKIFLRKDRGGVLIEGLPDKLLINSIKRLSIFSKDGSYMSQLNVPGGGTKFRSYGKNYVGFGTAMESHKFYRTINIYDSQLQKVKEVFRWLEDGNHDKNIHPITGNLQMARTHGNKIYINDGDLINVYNHRANKIQVIKPEKGYKKLEYTNASKKEVQDFYKKDPEGWAFLKTRISYPDYFPRIRSFNIINSKIYIETFEKKEGKTKFVIMDLSGKLIAKPFLPLQYVNIEKAYPYNFAKNKLYQLTENLDDEVWELNVTELKH